MTINFNGINNSLKQDQKIFEKNAGNFGGRLVKVLKQTLENLRNNHLLTTATFVVSNIAFALTALQICKLLFKVGEKKEWKVKTAAPAILIGAPLATLTTANTALYFALKPRLHPAAVAGISFVTFTGTFILAFIYAVQKDRKPKPKLTNDYIG